jgi:SAM-dependent methyltransferase
MRAETDWESAYQQGQTPWDKGEPAPELRAVFARGWLRGRVLVPGCGRGHDARLIGALGAGEVVGLDVAPRAVAEARQLLQEAAERGEAGGNGRPGVRFELGNLFSLGADWVGAFDSVWEHTCFCAIPPVRRREYVESMARVLRDGGCLVGVFFLNPEMNPGEEGPPFGASVGELEELFGERFENVGEWEPSSFYPGREGRERILVWRKRG